MLSGKVFEYLAAERPILAVVPPDGVAADLIRDAGAGVVVAPGDVEGIRAALADLHGRWSGGEPRRRRAVARSGATRISRRTRVQELADLLWSLE